MIETLNQSGEMTIEKILDLLGERYAKTSVEKSKDILKEILEFEMKDEETHEEYLDRYDAIVKNCEREKLAPRLIIF